MKGENFANSRRLFLFPYFFKSGKVGKEFFLIRCGVQGFQVSLIPRSIASSISPAGIKVISSPRRYPQEQTGAAWRASREGPLHWEYNTEVNNRSTEFLLCRTDIISR